MLVRELTVGELQRVEEIDVAESGDVVLRVRGKRLEEEHQVWRRPTRTPERWADYVKNWAAELEEGGCAFGAFAEDRLVGIIVLRDRVEEETAQLSALFVDERHRRRGVARALAGALLERARASGARELYVSATPSPSAVGFYQSQGFAVTDRVNARLFELEPEDVHMRRPLP
jgi:GNAT superfamily N-acetyltransferase